jgi:uncharacterized protein YjbI with pentapeptide repeats
MANQEHLELLKNDLAGWNAWRSECADQRISMHARWIEEQNTHRGRHTWESWCRLNEQVVPDLSYADLTSVDLAGADLSLADLNHANLSGLTLKDAAFHNTNLSFADLSGTDVSDGSIQYSNCRNSVFRESKFIRANLHGSKFHDADLSGSTFGGASLYTARFKRARMVGCLFRDTNMLSADFTGADLSASWFSSTFISGANFTNANMSNCDFEFATLNELDMTGVDLSGSRVYGVAVWNCDLSNATQSNLRINNQWEPEITLDSIEVAQFVHLMLRNEKLRQVIDAISSKVVLILGRFTPERKAVLDALREALRSHNYVPILFDFDGPSSRDLTETVSTLAHLARFIIADLTEPRSIPQELQAIVPTLAVPVLSLLARSEGGRPYGMFQDFAKYPWVLPVVEYSTQQELIDGLASRVIAPAEAKVAELRNQ